MEKIKLVAVVRDFDMYARCIGENPYCRDIELNPWDNRQENRSITSVYNSFIDSCSEDCWIVFCHEDWRLMSNLHKLLEGKDKSCIYGPFGVFIEKGRHADFYHSRGRIIQSRKDGTGAGVIVGYDLDGPVGSFDCMCVIAHSSLLREKGLRFDENLSFDMYVEDFCASAKERYDIQSHILFMDCWHYSEGDTGNRFYKALDYVREKYKDSKYRYATTVGRLNSYGGNWKRLLCYVREQPGARFRYWLLNKFL